MEILTNKSLRSSTSSIFLSTHYHFSQSFESSIRRKSNISFHVKHLIVPLAVLTRLNYNKKGKGRKKKFWEKSLRNIYKKNNNNNNKTEWKMLQRVRKKINQKENFSREKFHWKKNSTITRSFLSFFFFFF